MVGRKEAATEKGGGMTYRLTLAVQVVARIATPEQGKHHVLEKDNLHHFQCPLSITRSFSLGSSHSRESASSNSVSSGTSNTQASERGWNTNVEVGASVSAGFNVGKE